MGLVGLPCIPLWFPVKCFNRRHLTGKREAILSVVANMCEAFCACLLSRPARGAWIEIGIMGTLLTEFAVAPRKGRVD